ncbi:hypothetical protein [Paludibacterium paludis]|uniref:Uncharacterized protein n=1 Tax=Paludibacterium paludis TaxID=1225769 RepID=A0A918P5K9_9NEIS|nr:hypothetical protein [Paludibacterium paludis]GGY26513.1 hypothetical protein GCM10011289_32570 [Paludibacterium paludis]
MYDCQNDSYTEFSYASSRAERPLAGVLSARPLSEAGCLDALARFAREAGYDTEREDNTLYVHNITLRDALEANRRYGGTLLISCDLRRDPPAHFG